MNSIRAIITLILGFSTPILAGDPHARAKRPSLPYTFEENRGQTAADVRFVARGEGYGLFLTEREAVLSMARDKNTRQVIRMSLDGSSTPAIQGLERDQQNANYFIGDDRSQWQRDVPHFSRVRYGAVYHGIDLIYHSAKNRLEYDFVVSPQASPETIVMRFAGADRIRVTPSGALELGFGTKRLLHQAPVAYQDVDGRRRIVKASYEMRGDNRVGFRVEHYDRRADLVIDPVVIYSTFLGGDRTETAYAVATDAQGNTYVTGETTSVNFPVTGSGITQIQGAIAYSFITKYNADGTAIVYSTLLGGSSATHGYAIAVDRDGSAYVAGQTGAHNFPLVNPVQTTQPVLNIGYVAKLNPQGNVLLFSTYIGGERNDQVNALALDPAGNIHIAGSANSSHFPTANAIQSTSGGSTDAFVAMYAAPNYRLAYSTYLGKAGVEEAHGITADASGATYVTGLAVGEGMATAGAYQVRNIQWNDGWVAKINAGGTQLEWWTYYGAHGDEIGNAVALDAFGNVIIAGSATAADLPVTSSAYQKALRGDSDAFVAEFSSTGRDLLYASYLGSSSTKTGVTESASGVAVDAQGGIVVAGTANGADFPSVRPIQSFGGGTADGFVTRFTPGFAGISYSTSLGGSASDLLYGLSVDANGAVHVVGETLSSNFPLKNALRTTFAAPQEAFVTNICDPFLNVSVSSSLDFVYVPKQTIPPAQTVQISSCTPIPYQVEVTGSFLSATPLGGMTNATLNVSVQPGNLVPGTYNGSIKITAPDAINNPVTIGVVLHVAPPPPVISASAVVHAATALVGPVAPGELVVLYGTNLGPEQLAMAQLDSTGKVATLVAGSRFYFDGVPAPIVYTSSGVASVIVPYAVARHATTQIEAEYLGIRSSAVTVSVAQTSPGMFTANASGSGPGVILNQDSTLNTTENPAERGSAIAFYITGEGEVDPQGVDGVLANSVFPKPVQRVSVTIGGVPAEVLYAGAAPGMVAGVAQINVKVPMQIAPGANDVKVTVGGSASPSGVTVAVK